MRKPPNRYFAQLWADIWERDSGTCQYCGRAASGVDHIIALSRGGPTVAYNLVLACRECNSRKGIKVWIPWNLDIITADQPDWRAKILEEGILPLGPKPVDPEAAARAAQMWDSWVALADTVAQRTQQAATDGGLFVERVAALMATAEAIVRNPTTPEEIKTVLVNALAGIWCLPDELAALQEAQRDHSN